MIKATKNVFIFILLFFTFPLFAEVTVRATVDRNKVNAGEAINLIVSVSSDEAVNVAEPRLPQMNGFQLIGSSTGMEAKTSVINGQFKTLRTQKYNYRLAVPKVGSFLIDQIEVAVGGQSYKTNKINISVLAGGVPSNRGRKSPFDDPFFGSPGDDADDLFSQLQKRMFGLGNRNQQQGNNQRQNRGASPGGSAGILQSEIGDSAAAIRLALDKNKVYVGEQIIATWYLYTSGRVTGIDTLNYPSLNGFWKEDIKIATQLNFQNEIVNGVVRKKALLASYAIHPLKVGKATVDPYKAKMTVLIPQGFRRQRAEQVTESSKKVLIEVLPLPDGAPTNFTGAVGDYVVKAEVDKNSKSVNEPFTYKIRFQGKGNVKIIDLPKIDFPEGLELYDTKDSAKFLVNGNSFKEFELLVIPRLEGRMVIPSISLSIFNPKTKNYENKQTKAFEFDVLPSKNKEVIASQKITDPLITSGKADKKDKGMPAIIIGWKEYRGASLFDTFSFWLACFFAVSLSLLFIAKKELGWSEKKKNLLDVTKNRFQTVHSLVKQGEWRKVGVETTNLTYHVLGIISGEGGANMELEKLLLKSPPSVRRELTEEFKKLVEIFQILGFAPDSVVGDLKDKSVLKENVSKLSKIIERVIEKSFKDVEGEYGK